MIFDFLNILALLTIFTGVVTLVDFLRTREKRRELKAAGHEIKHPVLVDYSRAFFPVLLIVLILRAFIVQNYKVPTGSLEPTIMPGDMIAVNQYDYGVKLPLWDATVVHTGRPKTAQIALFRWPVNPGVTFVKRVIGMPGDKISYIDKVLYINGKKQAQKLLGDAVDKEGVPTAVKVYSENLAGYVHKIWIRPNASSTNFKGLVVPKGYYFMMGDNRDNSDDSRSWGFVPENAFLGRAMVVWMNFRLSPFSVDWHRIGTVLTPKKNVVKGS
jgi:signal peptidase I